jgi:hypothetical protein
MRTPKDVESDGTDPPADTNPEYLAGALGTGVGASGVVEKFRSNTRDVGQATTEQFGRRYASVLVATTWFSIVNSTWLPFPSDTGPTWSATYLPPEVVTTRVS